MKSASLQYANALADVALGQGAAAPVLKQLNDFGTSYADSAELRNFLFIIVDRRRMHMLPGIIAAFQEVIRQRQGIAEAEISSAAGLSAAQKTEIKKTLERLTGKRVEPKYSIDPALLGGAVVRIGDTIYDGSLRNRLNDLRARLAAE